MNQQSGKSIKLFHQRTQVKKGKNSLKNELESLYNDMNKVTQTISLLAHSGDNTIGSFSKSGTISPEIKSSSNSSIEKRFSPERFKIKGIYDLREDSPQKVGNTTQRVSTAKKISPMYQNVRASNFLQQSKFTLPLGKIEGSQAAFKIRLQNTDRGADYDDDE